MRAFQELSKVWVVLWSLEGHWKGVLSRDVTYPECTYNNLTVMNLLLTQHSTSSLLSFKLESLDAMATLVLHFDYHDRA